MDELREESERQKRFVAAFSHELKTPMTAMLGYASMLEKGQLPPAQQSKAAGYIFRESARLETLSRQLMQLMQLQEGGVELAPALLAPVLKQAAADLPELPVRLETECPQEASGRINVSLLTDLIRNLVLNAASAHPKDGVVRIQCVRQGDVWVLRVSDKGRGIPPDLLERVAEPFFRVDRGRSRSEGGNGLGLALCRMIAAAHKSELHIESRVDVYKRQIRNLHRPRPCAGSEPGKRPPHSFGCRSFRSFSHNVPSRFIMIKRHPLRSFGRERMPFYIRRVYWSSFRLQAEEEGYPSRCRRRRRAESSTAPSAVQCVDEAQTPFVRASTASGSDFIS